MSGEESSADEDGRLHSGPEQAAQQAPVLPVMTLEKKCFKSAAAGRGWLEAEDLIVTIFALFYCSKHNSSNKNVQFTLIPNI